MARLSPIANCMVVDVVGASPCGQASFDFGSSITTSACLPSAEPALEVRAIIATANRREKVMMFFNSTVSPDQDNASMTSSLGDHAEVAMRRLTRVDEERRRTGRRQCRGNLLPNMTALADSRNNYAPARGLENGDGITEWERQRPLQGLPEGIQSLLFELQRPHSRRNRRALNLPAAIDGSQLRHGTCNGCGKFHGVTPFRWEKRMTDDHPGLLFSRREKVFQTPLCANSTPDLNPR